MHIGILTLPLNTNYGGILQAYALSTYLIRLGHSVKLITRRKNHGSLERNALVWFKWNVIPVLARISSKLPSRLLAVEHFKQRYLVHATRPVFTTRDLVKLCKAEEFELIIVGSDQTWNRTAAPDLFNFYLDFCDELPSVTRTSYACSFAKDEWDYTDEETLRCKMLLEKFQGISVREANACAFVEEKFGRKATVHADPTLLLDRSHYHKLAAPVADARYCFSYILDYSLEKARILRDICARLGLTPASMDEPSRAGGTVETWLGLHAYSDFVFTDSYHGVLFAIIFQKPFIVIRNQHRGGARFNSILERVDLMQRMIDEDCCEFDSVLETPIDWTAVETKLKPWLDASRSYIDQMTVGHGIHRSVEVSRS